MSAWSKIAKWNETPGGFEMSIVRVGLAETKNYADGWDGIFAGKRKPTKPSKTSARKKNKSAKRRKK